MSAYSLIKDDPGATDMMLTSACQKRNFLVALLVCSLFASCTSLKSSTRTGGVVEQTHGGIKYTLHQDPRFVRVDKGKNGSLSYDSPELSMTCENGRLVVNGVYCGPVKPGDHVEVTDTQIVRVNGEHRGDITTGSDINRQRIQQSKLEVMR
jgi:hypothetical protein